MTTNTEHGTVKAIVSHIASVSEHHDKRLHEIQQRTQAAYDAQQKQEG